MKRARKAENSSLMVGVCVFDSVGVCMLHWLVLTTQSKKNEKLTWKEKKKKKKEC